MNILFTLNGGALEIADDFTYMYIGVLFWNNGSFDTNTKALFQKETKTMYGVIGMLKTQPYCRLYIRYFR